MLQPPPDDGRYVGRRKPYRDIGIRRKACTRCKEHPGVEQWACCANGNRWLPLCLPCDIELNELALSWLRLARRRRLMREYVGRLCTKFGDKYVEAALTVVKYRRESGRLRVR